MYVALAGLAVFVATLQLGSFVQYMRARRNFERESDNMRRAFEIHSHRLGMVNQRLDALIFRLRESGALPQTTHDVMDCSLLLRIVGMEVEKIQEMTEEETKSE